MRDGNEIQHKATIKGDSGFAFEGGACVPFVQPVVYDDLDDPQVEAPVDLQMMLGRFLAKLYALGDARKIGQHVSAMAYLAGQTPLKTKSELAAKLKVSPGRVSQILQEIPREFESLSRLKSRTAKARTSGRETS